MGAMSNAWMVDVERMAMMKSKHFTIEYAPTIRNGTGARCPAPQQGTTIKPNPQLN